jgi:kynureninase
MAAHKASLDIFEQAGMDAISAKRNKLTAFAERIIDEVFADRNDARIITPRQPDRRGAQLSLQFDVGGRELFDRITAAGIVADWRTPDVIRIAPAPLYNSFEDVVLFGKVLGS